MLQKLTIEEFDKFVLKVRRSAFETPFKIAKKEKLARNATEEDIEKIITLKEVRILILDEYVVEHNEEYVTIDAAYENCSRMLNAVVDRLVNNELNKMASEGEIECYFDDEFNDFRFKFKEDI
jgi:hypothetical protein